MRRVLVVGCSGAGKSTLSRRLSAATGLLLIELDRTHWRAGWQEPPAEEWRQIIAGFCGRPAWIMDGTYSRTLALRLPHADTVIWLDYPRHICLRRMLIRTAKRYGRVRDGLPEGCPERFSLEFLRYVWNFKARGRPRLAAMLEAHGSHAQLYRLESDADVESLFRELSVERAEFPDIAAGEP